MKLKSQNSELIGMEFGMKRQLQIFPDDIFIIRHLWHVLGGYKAFVATVYN